MLEKSTALQHQEMDDELIILFQQCREKKFSIRETAQAVRKYFFKQADALREENKKLGLALRQEQAKNAQGSLL